VAVVVGAAVVAAAGDVEAPAELAAAQLADGGSRLPDQRFQAAFPCALVALISARLSVVKCPPSDRTRPTLVTR
jgi:hypothetical protein